MPREQPPAGREEDDSGPTPIGPDVERLLDRYVDASRGDAAQCRRAFPPIHNPQGIPLTDPRSHYLFMPSPDKPFVATPAALALYGPEKILACLTRLQVKARLHKGLDYLQVFTDPGKPEPLWFIEDDGGGAITALLPSDY